MTQSIIDAYQHCADITYNHYENFPVASFFLPKKIRKPITAIYAFARLADDYADEGDLTQTQRLNELDSLSKNLDKIKNNELLEDPVFVALKDAIVKFNLPLQLFYDLLIAFKQDVTKNRYQDFLEVLDYCKYSANPIGRLLLHLTNNNTEQNLILSDKICTALQLINFYQDFHEDLTKRNRCYFDSQSLNKNNISIKDLTSKKTGVKINKYILNHVNYSENLLLEGSKLGKTLPGLFGLELRAMIQGGLTVVEKLKTRQTPYDRPVLHKWDLLKIFFKAILK